MCADSQAGIATPVVGSASIGGLASHSRSEDEESTGVKDVKRTAAQAFSGGGGVPKRRSSSRLVLSERCHASFEFTVDSGLHVYYPLPQQEAHVHSHLQCKRTRCFACVYIVPRN